MKILIVGVGSIGQRHIKNLKKIGQRDLLVFDTDSQKAEEVAKTFKLKLVNSLKAGLDLRPEAVFICTPPALHIGQALKAAKARCHLFIEKPISHNLKKVDYLIKMMEKNKKVLMIGFNLRFHPLLLKIKKILEKRRLGKIWGARIQCGSYLPDWHPGHDYCQEYSAKKELGGGVVLDSIHEIDYALWFFGKVKAVKAMGGKVSNLGINTEDLVEILLNFDSGAIVEIHLDYLQKIPQRQCEIIAEKGTLFCDLLKSELRVFWLEVKKQQRFRVKNFDFNTLYIKEIKSFLNCIQTGKKPPVDGKKACESLKIALRVKQDL